MTVKNGEQEIVNSNNLGQVNTFVNEMKVGDWVITKGASSVRIGRICSEPRFDDVKVPIRTNVSSKEDTPIYLEHKLKRSVEWGPSIKKSDLPTDILLSLRSPKTVYSIDKHYISLCHTIYPFFQVEDTFHFSLKIAQGKSISNFYLTKIFEYLNELDFLSEIDIDEKDLNKLFKQYIEDDSFSLGTQASFHSPGEIWGALGNSSVKMARAVVLYSFLFGNSQIGIDGVLDLETRQKLWEIAIERVDRDLLDEAVMQLQLQPPQYETKDIEPMIKENTDLA